MKSSVPASKRRPKIQHKALSKPVGILSEITNKSSAQKRHVQFASGTKDSARVQIDFSQLGPNLDLMARKIQRWFRHSRQRTRKPQSRSLQTQYEVFVQKAASTAPVATASAAKKEAAAAPVGSVPAAAPQDAETHYARLANFLDEIVAGGESQAGILRDSLMVSRGEEKSAYVPIPAEDPGAKARLMGQEIELREAHNAIADFKRALEQERKAHERREKETAAKCEESLAKQKKELEEVIERHVKFIEQLVKDKKDLTDTLEATKEKSKDDDAKWAKKMKEQQKSHEIELKKSKEAWMAAEKLRKEKWEKEKVHEIKVNTTKALQPELVSLIQKYQQQLKQAEEQFAENLAHERDLLAAAYEAKLSALRDKSRSDTEEALAKERALGEQKLRQEQERLEKGFEEQRARMRGEWEAEGQRTEAARKEERERYERQLAEARKAADQQLDTARKYYEDRMHDLEKRQDLEIRKAGNQLTSENAVWRSAETQRVTAELRKQMELQRNQEIEMVINKLGEESQEFKKQMARQTEAQVQKAVEKSADEVRALKKAVADWGRKYDLLKRDRDMLDSNLRVMADRVSSNQNGMEEKDRSFGRLREECEELQKRLQSADEDRERQLKEMEERYKKVIEELEADVQSQNDNLLLIQKEREQESRKTQEQSAKELQQIEDRVKRALSKKDEDIARFKAETGELRGQLEKYRELLAAQRSEMLSHPNP